MESRVTDFWLLRSLLFCPANEHRKVARLAQSGADAVVLDLEDAVADAHKAAARTAAREALSGIAGVTRCVRINSLGTGYAAADVAAVVCPELEAIVLPKAETVQDLRRLDRLIARAEAENGMRSGAIRVLALIETWAGIAAGRGNCCGGSAALPYDIRRGRPRGRSRAVDDPRRSLSGACLWACQDRL